MKVLSEWHSPLLVDEHDPFFFDHPLDHVPGMLIFDGMTRAAAEAVGTLSPWAHPPTALRTTALTCDFPSFCEKDRPVQIWIRLADTNGNPDPSGGSGAGDSPAGGTDRPGGDLLLAEAWQDDIRVGSAQLTLAGDDPDPAGPVPDHTDAPRADPHLVHKRIPSNVLIGPLRVGTSDGRGVPFETDVPVPPGRLRALVAPTTLLVEATRQLVIMAGHQVTRVPMEWRYVITTLRLRLSEPVGWSQPVSLRSHSEGQDERMTGFDVEVRSGGRSVGRIVIRGRGLPPPVYHRLRYAGRAVAAGPA